MYQIFYDDLISFTTSTGLSTHSVTGIEARMVSNAQYQLKKTIPISITDWLVRAGSYSADWQEYDADLTFKDFINSQTSAISITNDPSCKWKISSYTLPISSRIGGEFLFVMTDMGDDPPIYRYVETSDYPTQCGISFTSYIRQKAIEHVDFTLKSAFLSKLTYVDRQNAGLIVDKAYEDLEVTRKEFIEKVHTEDISKRHITGPRDFQLRWVEEVKWLKVTQALMEKHLYVPWNWV